MNLAVIPARGGSKRIIGKNIRTFCSKPIIAYSIEAAKQSGVFDKIIVSTDCEKIKETALEWGAEVPFLRPNQLADDFTGTVPVIVHAIEFLQNEDMPVENVCCIYATAPFLRSQDLRIGLDIIQQEGSKYAFPISNFDFPIDRALLIDNQDQVKMVKSNEQVRSQDLPDYVHDAGQFYWAKTETWLCENNIFANGSKGIRLPRYLVNDIDTEEDWKVAELMFRSLNLGNNEQ